MPYIKRALEKVFLKLNNEYPVILINGSRQTGKTTMLLKLLESEKCGRKYISLDNLNERNLVKSDPEMFFQIHKPPIFIDEVQYAPELLPYIKIHTDKYKNKYGNTDLGRGDFWLTASHSFKLMDAIKESLTGCIAFLHMSSMSQSEITGVETLPFDLSKTLYENRKKFPPVGISEIYERIFKGGMPTLVSGECTDRKTFYNKYINTYLIRDVKELSGTIDSFKFYKFITAAAALTAQLVNYKTIADNCGIDQVTAKSWLRILEKLGIIYFLHPYSNKTLKRVIKTPKLYFYDSGLVAYLTKWNNSKALQNGAMSDAILKNYIVSEIIKSWKNIGKEPYIYYYRDKDGKEIDILLERDGMLFPIEINKTAIPDSRLLNVFKVINKADIKRGSGAVICMAEQFDAFDTQNLIVPMGVI